MKQLITLTAILLTLYSSYSQTIEQDSLTILLIYQKQDTAKVDTSLKLIKSLYNSNNFKKALIHIKQSEKLASSLNYYKGNAEIKYYKALIYTQKDDYFNALDYYKKAAEIFKKLNDFLGIAKVNNNIGLIEIKRGNYNKGLRYSLSAIDVFERENLKPELSLAYNNISKAYFNTKQFDKALDFNYKALQVREQLKDTTGIILSTKKIAQLYSKRKEHRKAIEYYQKTLNYLDTEKDKKIRGEVLPKIGREYLQFNDFVKASSYLLEGLRLNRSIKNNEGILRSLNNLANLNLRLNKVRLAELQLNEAYAITNKVDNNEELLENFRLRVTIDSIKQDFKNAFNWQREYHILKKKIEKANAVTLIIEEPLNIDSALDKPIISQNVTTIDKAFTKKLKLVIYGLLISLIILSLILISILIRKKSKRNSITQLEEKNEEFKLEKEAILDQVKHLEDINQVKDRLFSIVSHDLKDSITSIKAFLDLLKDESISQEEFHELIPELSDNADNASALLLNLLNWSKSQMQNLKPKPELFNIQDVFKEKMDLIQKKVEQKRIVLLDESIKDFVFADRNMIEIVIQNLLANAVKFSKIGDVITISNRERNSKVLICIEDTGVGISKENQKNLFENNGFTTIGTNEEKGTGLGLSICKELVELNNGTIWVESEPNLGSKFFVELPKIKPIS